MAPVAVAVAVVVTGAAAPAERLARLRYTPLHVRAIPLPARFLSLDSLAARRARSIGLLP